MTAPGEGAGPAVVILGAGHGRRMGGPKIFKRHGGRTFLERILGRCAESRSPVLLTVDAAFRREVEALLADRAAGAPRLVTSDGAAPMLGSVQAALAHAQPGRGFWLWPVDAPFLSAAGWARAVQAAGEAPEAIWKLRAMGRTGHPIWFPGWSVAEILAGRWDGGLLGFLAAHAGRVRILALQSETIGDFNTPEGLAALTADP